MNTDMIIGIGSTIYLMVAFLILIIRVAERLAGRLADGKVAKPATLVLRITITSLTWPLLWAYLLIKENTGRSAK